MTNAEGNSGVPDIFFFFFNGKLSVLTFSRFDWSRPRIVVPGLELDFKSELPECNPPLSVTLFLKPCLSFLGPKNNVLGRWLSEGSVVGIRHFTFWEGSSRASTPVFLQLGRVPGAFRSGRPQMPPLRQLAWLWGQLLHPTVPRDPLPDGFVLLLPDSWKLSQTPQRSWLSPPQTVGLQIKHRMRS